MSKFLPRLGNNLKSAREAVNMTQLTLAHAIGHTGEDAGSYISKIESGKHVPRVHTLVAFSVILGVSLDSLTGGKKE